MAKINSMTRVAVIVLGIMLFPACASFLPGLMPKKEVIKLQSWSSYGELKNAYDAVAEGKTTLGELRSLGFDLYSVSGAEEWNEVRVRNFILGSNSSTRLDDMDVKAQECIRGSGRSLVFPVENITTKGVGNIVSRELEYVEENRKEGYGFWAWFCYRPRDGVVVYKLSDPKPLINELDRKKDPLGPAKKILNFGRKIICPWC